MTDNYDIDPKRAAEIERRMSQAFNFLRDVIDAPETLEQIPDGSTLRFHDIVADGRQLHLTAAQRAKIDPKWTARVTGPTLQGDAQPPYPQAVETGETAEAALGALAARFYSFRHAEQATDALRVLAELIPRAPTDPYLWKWVVSLMHDALHGFMGLALRGSHGAQLLTPEQEQQTYARWAEERRLGRLIAPSEPRQIDSFLNLYQKIQDPERMEHFMHSKAFSPTPVQDKAIRWLDSYWNELTFYSDTTLGLTVSWFPTMILECLNVVKWLLEESHTMMLFPEEEVRAREMIRRVSDAAKPLVDLFASDEQKTTE